MKKKLTESCLKKQNPWWSKQMKKQILIFTLIFATVVVTAFFASCVTTEHHANANFPAAVETAGNWTRLLNALKNLP